jgi:hypothetical protein
VNLTATANQRQLVATLRRASAAAPAEATAWDVLDAAAPAVPRWGLLDWCLALEELGTAGRDVALAWAVHAALEASPAEPPALASVVERCRTEVGGPLTGDGLTDRGLIVRAAYAIGVGQGCLELAQARAADRTISGRRLIELQGPAHRLAHVAVQLAGARIGVWRAATGTSAGSSAAACAASSVQAAVVAAHELVQAHGAAGTGDLRVVELYRLAYALPLACGSPQLLWERAGREWLAGSVSSAEAC